MKVDWTYKMLNWDSLPITENNRIVTLSDVAINALLAPSQADKDGVAKLHKFELALKVRNDADLTTDEVSEIKKAIGTGIYGPLIVGQAWKIMEGQETGL